MLIMFVDGLMFDNYNSKESMALMHMDLKPVLYTDPTPPNQKEYWEEFDLVESLPSTPDVPLEPEIVYEDGQEVRVYHIYAQNVLHELRTSVKMPMFSFNRQIPSPTIRVTEGDRVRVIFYNNGTEQHTIHWHGINNLTSENDGVPYVTQHATLPGESFTYEFTAGPSGSKMYHCHVEAPHHINMGMFGALIVDPLPENGGVEQGNPFDKPVDVERTMLLSEFDTSHAHVSLPGEMMPMGPDGSLPWLHYPGRKFIMPFKPEMNEFLINGKSFPDTDFIKVEAGDIVRLRFMNLGKTPHPIHIHGHEFIVTHRDGFLLPEPFKVDTLLVGSGERYDAWFEANNPGLWVMHDHAGAEMASGYDPAGMLTVIQYGNQTTEAFEMLLERIHVYKENIEHMDDDHGKLTPSVPVAGGHEMGGMEHGGGGGH